MSTVITSGITGFLAAEYLRRQLGVEAVQTANVPESVTVVYLTDTASMTAHLRAEVGLGLPASTTEAAAMPTVAWNPAGTTVSAGLFGQAVQFSKVISSLDAEALASVAKQQGSAIGREVDTALFALATSLTAGNVLGSGTSSTLTVSDILVANANLRTAHAEVAGGFVGRFHPHQFANLYQDILSKNFGIAKIDVDATSGTETITIGGTQLRQNSLVAHDASSLYWNGCVYSEQAIALAIAQNASVEVLPIPGSHAFSVDGTIAFGVTVWRPTFGALVQSSKTA